MKETAAFEWFNIPIHFACPNILTGIFAQTIECFLIQLFKRKAFLEFSNCIVQNSIFHYTWSIVRVVIMLYLISKSKETFVDCQPYSKGMQFG